MAGIVTSAGVFVTVGAARLPLPATDERLSDWAELLPCPHCGTRGGCDCLDWLEPMAAANNDRHTRDADEGGYVA